VLLSVWSRSPSDPLLELPWPAYTGRSLHVEPVFPSGDEAWTWEWDPETAVLTARTTPDAATARTVRLRFGNSM
jgi:hypothetical protein